MKESKIGAASESHRREVQWSNWMKSHDSLLQRKFFLFKVKCFVFFILSLTQAYTILVNIEVGSPSNIRSNKKVWMLKLGRRASNLKLRTDGGATERLLLRWFPGPSGQQFRKPRHLIHHLFFLHPGHTGPLLGGGGPELTARVRLPVVVFPAEGHAVEVGTLLLSEITGSCGTGLWREDTFKKNHQRLFRYFYVIACV